MTDPAILLMSLTLAEDEVAKLKKAIDRLKWWKNLYKKQKKDLISCLSDQEDRIAQLENGLQQLRSQLLDPHAEDSVIIMTINNILKDDELK